MTGMGSSESFVHLHTHTEFSMLDGAARVAEIVAAAAADGQPALGITDHGNMYGVLDFYQACREAGVKPVLGTEAYMALNSRHDRPARRGRRIDDEGGDAEGGQKLYYHLTLLAETDTGYRNLIKLASLAFLEGYYYKPRMDWDLLERHAEGLIATTGCLGSVVQQALLDGDRDSALKRAGRLQDIFGRDNLFVELQDHGIAAQRRCNPELVWIADQLGAPLLATNDLHYTREDDHLSHDALLCVQTGSLMSDPDRFRFEGQEHYLKSAAQMRSLFAELPRACDNTLWVAERADVTIEFGAPQLPDFAVPDGFADGADYLAHLTFEGARDRWGADLPAEVAERLAYELKVICDMGFAAYFLIVWDLIRHARDSGIRVGPGRGSAAGCAVAYALRITDLDPIRYDLLFERFLNPGRVSMPDIDMDFDDRYRDEMIRYTAERYGREHVAQIVTFSTIKARAAVRDAARVLGHPYVVGDRIAKAMPPLVMGRDTPLWACFERDDRHADGYANATELRQMYHEDTVVKEVVDVARGLEGLRRQDSIHAAAVVITRDPMTEYLPVQRKPENGQPPDDASIVTQFEMNGVEALGLLKMDYLGLRNLSVIEDTLDLVERVHGVRVDIDAVPLDDETTFEMLRRADTVGVFQLESGPMRQLIKSLRPTTFDDVAALNALYRPGPMAANMHNDYADRKNCRKSIEPLHPDAADLLDDTYQLMIYQESMMRVAQRLAGYTLAEADDLRKACGKKKRDLIARHREKFIAGCVANGYAPELGKRIFDIIEPFADYAFNKSHAYGYGLIAYQTAYLKAHYPAEYMAALLTSVKSNLDRAAVYLADCRNLGLAVDVPDVNRSSVDFTSAGGRIPFGLSAVRNVGVGIATAVVDEREANGPYTDFHDFCERVPLEVLNRRAVESLVQAGAFDGLGHPRQGLLAVHDHIIDRVTARRRESDMGIQTLFGDPGGEGDGFDDRTTIPDLEFDQRTLQKLEREMLGLYVSSHPLDGVSHTLRRSTDCSLGALPERHPQGTAQVAVGGVVAVVDRRFTRGGEQMAIVTIEDTEGSVEVAVFPRSFAEHGHKLTEDAIVIVRGRYEAGDRPKVICAEVDVVTQTDDSIAVVRIRVAPHRVSAELVAELKQLLRAHPGDSDVYLHIGDQVVRLPDEFRVEPRSGLAGELRALLGPEALAA
jgi:DNA polymerase III subunit alpha